MTAKEFVKRIEKDLGLKLKNAKNLESKKIENTFWVFSPTGLELFLLNIYFSDIDNEWRIGGLRIIERLYMVSAEKSITRTDFVQRIENLLGLKLEKDEIEGFWTISPTGFKLFKVDTYANNLTNEWRIDEQNKFDNKLKSYHYKV